MDRHSTGHATALRVRALAILLAVVCGPALAAPPCTDPPPDDADCDGVPDPEDNCPLHSNTNQRDRDGDGQGDVCDPCPDDPLNDGDHDGFCAVEDNCPGIFNPGQEDLDGDGAGDLCDLDDGLIYVQLPHDRAVTWQWEAGPDAFNVYRGDLDLLRERGLFTQDPALYPLGSRACRVPDVGIEDGLLPQIGTILFYLVSGSTAGREGSLGAGSDGLERFNDAPCPECDTAFKSLVIDQMSGITQPQFRVIGSRSEWCVFYPPACNSRLVDFNDEVALAVATGSRISDCYDVRITCVRTFGTASEVLVEATEIVPGFTCPCIPLITTPLHVVTIPRPVSLATFKRGFHTKYCPR